MMMSLEGGFQDQNTRFDEKCLLKKHIFSKLPYVKDHCITPCCLTGACKEMMDSGPEHNVETKLWSRSTPFKETSL